MLQQCYLHHYALLLVVLSSTSLALSSPSAPRRVLVTGAGGRTGRLVLQQLLASEAFDPVGLVRTKQPSSENKDDCTAAQTIVADIRDAGAMREACGGMDAMIICTSATPSPLEGQTTADGRPVFGYPNGQPEEVDWLGQKNQIDAAKQAGVSHIVVCSSMGGTNPDNPLNQFGRNEDGTGGNILLWKRKAEQYLIDSGVTYTILHPGGLTDDAGGERELVLGVDDEQHTTDNRSIPRADVARLLVAALEHESYRNRSFDARSRPVGEGDVTTDFDQLLKDMTTNCDYTKGRTM